MTDPISNERLADQSAFPVLDSLDGSALYCREAGMTLRDWFAGQALAGHLASLNPTAEHDPDSAAAFARSSYQIADAMLAARNAP